MVTKFKNNCIRPHTQALVSMLVGISLILIQWSMSVVQFLVICFAEITEPQ
jgi:hypothetical protein